MHAIHHDRRPLLAAAVALALGLMAAAAPSLSDLDFGRGTPEPASAGTSQAAPQIDPAWLKDPLAPPALLRGER